MGELLGECLTKQFRMLREFKVNARVGRPQVAYRETITQHAREQGRYVRQSGGRGQYGDVWLEVDPLEPGSGLLGKEYTKEAEAESDHHLHMRAAGIRGDGEAAEGLWRISLGSVDGWALRAV